MLEKETDKYYRIVFKAISAARTYYIFNIAAFFFGINWAIYRKMYGFALGGMLLLALLIGLGEKMSSFFLIIYMIIVIAYMIYVLGHYPCKNYDVQKYDNNYPKGRKSSFTVEISLDDITSADIEVGNLKNLAIFMYQRIYKVMPMLMIFSFIIHYFSYYNELKACFLVNLIYGIFGNIMYYYSIKKREQIGYDRLPFYKSTSILAGVCGPFGLIVSYLSDLIALHTMPIYKNVPIPFVSDEQNIQKEKRNHNSILVNGEKNHMPGKIASFSCVFFILFMFCYNLNTSHNYFTLRNNFEKNIDIRNKILADFFITDDLTKDCVVLAYPLIFERQKLIASQGNAEIIEKINDINAVSEEFQRYLNAEDPISIKLAQTFKALHDNCLYLSIYKTQQLKDYLRNSLLKDQNVSDADIDSMINTVISMNETEWNKSMFYMLMISKEQSFCYYCEKLIDICNQYKQLQIVIDFFRKRLHSDRSSFNLNQNNSLILTNISAITNYIRKTASV
ncbi:MAG: hypothetical protein IJ730_04705, partial [Alphaproteobacteria bacterium]|nr:hypothetical protein [Alphaproteobacteria bacterium]